MADLTHVRSALAVVVGDENHRARAEAEARAGVFLELHAAEYLDRLRRGDMGAAAAYLGSLRQGSDVDPWRLVEAVAARALAAGDAAAAPSPGEEGSASPAGALSGSAGSTEGPGT